MKCEACGGKLIVLGGLGIWIVYRCRDCGIDHIKEA
jgi:DNA-directed RNA polymerase subunit RPC12/RpoP